MLRGTTVESYHEGACVHRGDGSLDYILHPEGVVRATGQGLSHECFLKDHLGNTRVVFGSNGAVLQATDYYAFGLEHTPLAISNANRYLYNGKELQDETFAGGVRLGWYDYGWRMYYPQIGRWHVPDPLSETFQESFTPYHYCLNNPVLHTDPDGRIIPLLAVAAVIVGKAIIAAAIDGGTQYAVSRAQGMTHGEAIDNLDYTSMGASAVIGGATVPGASTTVKTALTVTAVATDALVDVNKNETKTAFGIGGQQEKPLTNVALDATFGALGAKAPDAIVDGSKKSVANDLTPSNYAPLTASEKQTVRTTESVVNSGAFEQTVNAATNVTVGSSGVINSTIKTNTASTTGTTTTTTTFTPPVYTMPSDNTRVVKPIYPF